MKVAILGAGLSGLTCAHALEQAGITPTIFEDRRMVGDRFVNGEIILPVLDRPRHDPFAYLAQQHELYIQPRNNITKLRVYSEHNKAEISGQLGFITIRGRHGDSLENQLANRLTTDIICNAHITYEEALREFTHIILAVGDYAYTGAVQGLRYDLTVSLKGAAVEGRFDERTVAAWLDNRFAPKGYCYLIPYSEREANITIAFPEYPETCNEDIQVLWERFYDRVCSDLNQELRITDQFEITGYQIGICETPRIGNTFFVGNCFGSIMPALGFGQTTAMFTGILAAQDLLGEGDYGEAVETYFRSYADSLAIRRALETMDNAQYDTMVEVLNTKAGNWIVTQRRFNALKILARLLKPFFKN